MEKRGNGTRYTHANEELVVLRQDSFDAIFEDMEDRIRIDNKSLPITFGSGVVAQLSDIVHDEAEVQRSQGRVWSGVSFGAGAEEIRSLEVG